MFNNYRRDITLKGLALSLSLCIAVGSPGLAQQPLRPSGGDTTTTQNTAGPQANAEQIVQVIALRNLAAQEAAQQVRSLLGDLNLQIAVDSRTNTIVARGTTDELKSLSKILETLDANPVPRPSLKTIELEKISLRRAMEVLNRVKVDDVEIAVAGDERLILRGDAEGLARVEELIRLATPPTKTQPRELVVEVLWLTESPVPDADPFTNEIAEKLQQRGFKDLKVLSQLEVSTVEGMSCEAQGAARIGDLDCEFSTETQGDGVGLEVQLQATYVTDEIKEQGPQVPQRSMDQLRFRTSVKTSLDRWIVFGVAQRAGATGPNRGRDLFLIRVHHHEPL